MPSPREILHNRTFQHPSKPSTPVNMEHVWNLLLARKQSQKQYFDHDHNAKEQQLLDPCQEVLFLFPAENEYIPRTIFDRPSTPHSYNIEVQGKCYCRTREHIRPIHLNIFKHPLPQPKLLHPAASPNFPHQIEHFPTPPCPTVPSLKQLPCFPTAVYPGCDSITVPGLYPLPKAFHISQSTLTPLLLLKWPFP